METPIAFVGGTVLDGLGRDPIRNGVVLVDGRRIVAVGPEHAVPTPHGARKVDAAGRTIMPGLIDSHVHIASAPSFDQLAPLKEISTFVAIRAATYARAMLLAGITAFREAGAVGLVGIGLQQAIDAGVVPGPRIVACGQYISMTGRDSAGRLRPEIDNRMEVQVTGADEVRRAAREQLRRGATAIKVMATGLVSSDAGDVNDSQLTVEEMRAGVEVAHTHGRHAFSHAHGTQGCWNAVKAGVDSIEHGSFLDEEVVEMMVRQGTYLVPTQSFSRRVELLGQTGEIPAHYVRKGEHIREARLASYRLALDRGVRIAMGSDAGMPHVAHDDAAFEIACMVQNGMSPMQAIVASTSSAADLLRLPEVGRLQAGKLADLILVDGDPLDDIAVLQDKARIRLVMKDGAIYRDTIGSGIGVSPLMSLPAGV